MSSSNVVQLVPSTKRHRKGGPRPFSTWYYAAAHERPRNFLKIGHAASTVGAIRAAVGTIMKGNAQRVDVYDEDEYMVARITKVQGGVTIREYE